MMLKRILSVENLKRIFIYVLIFVSAMLLRYFLIQSCPLIQVDEPSSFYVTTPSNSDKNASFSKKSWCRFEFEKDKEFPIIELQNLLFSVKPGLDSLISDLKIIRTQSIDRQHPCLYYYLLRIWDSSLNDFDYTLFLNHARSLNLIFFIFSFFFLYKLLSLIKNDRVFISTGLIFTFFSLGTLNLTVMAREYELQMLFFIIVSYIFCLIYKSINENRMIQNYKIPIYGISFGLFLLSGYFSTIYAFFVIFTLFVISIVKRNKINLLKLLLIIIFALTTVLVLCPDYFIFSKGNEHYKTIADTILSPFGADNIKALFNALKYYLPKYLFYLPVLCIIFAFLIFDCFINKNWRKTFKSENYVLILILFSLIWVFLTMFLTPHKASRFILPSIPVLSLVLTILTCKIETKILRYFIILCFVGISIFHCIKQSYYDVYDRSDFFMNTKDTSFPIVINEGVWDFEKIILIFVTQNPFNIIKIKTYQHSEGIYETHILFSDEGILNKNAKVLDVFILDKTYLIELK